MLRLPVLPEAGRIPGDNRTRRHIPGDDCSRTDDCSLADPDRENGRIRAYADFVFDNGFFPVSRVSLGRVDIVDEHHTVSDEAIVPDRYELADECVTLDSCPVADRHALLDLGETANHTVITDGAAVHVDEIPDLGAFTNLAIVDDLHGGLFLFRLLFLLCQLRFLSGCVENATDSVSSVSIVVRI